MDKELQAILDKYNEDKSDSANTAPQPFEVSLGDAKYTVKNPQDVQALLDSTMTNAARTFAQVQQEREQLAARVAELERANATPPRTSDEPKPLYDPMKFVEDMTKDPVEAIGKALEKDPSIAEKLLSRTPQFQQLRVQTELQNFAARHPIYAAHPQTMQGLGRILQEQNLPVNAANLEMAAGYAVMNGWLPHENVVRQQQQQMWREQMAQQAQGQPQNQFNEFGEQVQPPASYNGYRPQPPPMMGNNRNNSTNVESKINELFTSGNMSTQDMKAALTRLEKAQGGANF